jgi:S-adenosylmethionine:tRNA ribosyltransferase-isomerase
MKFRPHSIENELCAEKISPEGEAWRIRFSWDSTALSFGDVLETSGHIPLPPYISREDEEEDGHRYQTVYSSVKGSVAAPTAGLHFTPDLLEELPGKGIKSANITLHVGAGTFQQVRTRNISDHKMHCEHFFVTKETISELLENHGRIIAVGTTSVRTLESLYWLGVKTAEGSTGNVNDLKVEQWEPYQNDQGISVREALTALSGLMTRHNWKVIDASTKIIIVPGYKFKMIAGMITNFHQPRSTLLLLVSAWTGTDWQKIYTYALENKFRFLSYGDSSLLFR